MITSVNSLLPSLRLMLDNSLEPVAGANGIVIGDTYTDLFEEHGISQNWKFNPIDAIGVHLAISNLQCS